MLLQPRQQGVGAIAVVVTGALGAFMQRDVQVIAVVVRASQSFSQGA